MQKFISLLKWFASAAGSVLFLRSNAFEMSKLKVEELMLLTEAEVERQLTFLKRVIMVPAGLASVACLGGWLIGVKGDQAWAIDIAHAMTITAGLWCAVGLFAVWLQATLFAHVLVAGTRLGFAFARAVTGMAGKAIGTDLAIDAKGPENQEAADKLAAWLKNIVAWVAVVCALAMVLPIWQDPGKTALITVMVIALAMFMSKIASPVPQRVAVWSMLGATAYVVAQLLFPVQVTVASQWVADYVGADEQAERVLVRSKMEELTEEKLAIKKRALEAEKLFASVEDQARYAAIEVLLEGYAAELGETSTPATVAVARPSTVVVPAPASAGATPAPTVPPSTLEPLPAAEGVAAMEAPASENATTVAEVTAPATASNRTAIERAKEIARRHGKY